MELKKLKEDCGSITRELQSIAAEVAANPEADNEEKISRYEKLENEKAEIEKQVRSLEIVERSKALKVENVERSFRREVASPEEQDLAFRCWALTKSGNENAITGEMRRAAEKSGVSLSGNYIARAQSLTAAEGGYTVNGALYSGLEKSLKAFGGMRSVAKIIKSENGAPLKFATLNDTSNVGEIVAENTAGSNVSLTFGTKTLGSFKYTSRVYPVSVELLQDSGENISALVGEALGERIARITNTHFTVGSGTTQPWGLFSRATNGKTATDDTTTTVAELLNLYHSVDPAYRADPSCGWMMNDATWAYIRSLEDDNNRPLFLTDYINDNGPGRIFGKPVIINQDAPAMTAGLKPIAFGAFNRHYIRDVQGVEIRVLNEVYAEQGSVGFVAFARHDSELLNTAAVKVMTMAGS